MPMTIIEPEAPPTTAVLAITPPASEPAPADPTTLAAWENASGITARTYDQPHQSSAKTIHAAGSYLGVDCPLGHPLRHALYGLTDREVMFADNDRVLFKPVKLKLDLSLHPSEYARQLVRERGKPLEPISKWLWDEAHKIKTKTPTRVQLESARRVIDYWINQRDRLACWVEEQTRELRESQIADAIEVLKREATRTKRPDIIRIIDTLELDELQGTEPMDGGELLNMAIEAGNLDTELLLETAEENEEKEGTKLWNKGNISGAQVRYHNADLIDQAVKKMGTPPWLS